MELKEEQYITVLADCGNITVAAEKLFISQPALSMYVKKIERNLGVKLFDRTGKKFVLTYAGELYVKKAKAMLRLDQEFHAELLDMQRNEVGELSIGIESALSPLFLPPLLTKFRKAYPNVKWNIQEGLHHSLENMLEKHTCTFYLLHLQELRPQFHCIKIWPDQLVLLMAKDSPLQAKLQYDKEDSPYPYISLKDCFSETFILPMKFQNIRRHVEHIFEQENIYPNETLEIRMFNCAAALASENIGICFLREYYLKEIPMTMLPKPLTTCIFSTPQLRRNDIYLCYLRDHILTEYETFALNVLKTVYK